MDYTSEDYIKYYVIQALFKLMSEYDYKKITVIDIAEKAGIGRATFYRHFKKKEDVIVYYFERYTKQFIYSQRYYQRCKEDYLKLITEVLTMFKEHKEPFRLIRAAHLEYLYIDYLNGSFINNFKSERPDMDKYMPYGFSGMLFNISMAWLDDDCAEPPETVAKTVTDIIFTDFNFKQI